MLTQSGALIAAAAVSHLSRSGKSKEMVDEVAPERAPLKAIVMITSVHIKFFSFLVRLTASVTRDLRGIFSAGMLYLNHPTFASVTGKTE